MPDAKKRLYEDFLGQILSHIGVASQVAAIGDYFLLIELHQRLESSQVPVAGTHSLSQKFFFLRQLGGG